MLFRSTVCRSSSQVPAAHVTAAAAPPAQYAPALHGAHVTVSLVVDALAVCCVPALQTSLGRHALMLALAAYVPLAQGVQVRSCVLDPGVLTYVPASQLSWILNIYTIVAGATFLVFTVASLMRQSFLMIMAYLGSLSAKRRSDPSPEFNAWPPVTIIVPAFNEAGRIENFARQQSAFVTSAHLLDDGIIDPRDTRRVLTFTLSIARESVVRPLNPITFGVARM